MNTVPRTVFLVLAVAFAANAAFGADTPPAPDPAAAPPALTPPTDTVTKPPEPVEVVPVPAIPVPAIPDPAPAGDKAPTGPATMEQLQADVGALREDMRMLQSTLDLMVNKIMADLREENEQLRDEIRRLNALRGAQGMSDINAVPRPAGAAIDQALSEATAKHAPPPPPFKFTITREWGRSAEEAQKLGGEAQALKGIIGVVPAGSVRESLVKLARELRQKYDAYDNINIEVFDDPVVANLFASSRTADAAHRVLSVSRHKASNRDAIVLLTNGKGEIISIDPNAPLPAQQPDDMPTLSVTNPVSPGAAKRPKAVDKDASADAATGAPQDQKVSPAPEDPSALGKWQKGDKKERVKGSSKKRKGESKDEKMLPESQRPIPEGVPVLVPHQPDSSQAQNGPEPPRQPETVVLVAPPGEPVNQELPQTQPVTQEASPADSPAATPEKEAVSDKTVKQENPEKAPANPKAFRGAKAKKK